MICTLCLKIFYTTEYQSQVINTPKCQANTPLVWYAYCCLQCITNHSYSSQLLEKTFNTARMYQAFNHGQKSLLEISVHQLWFPNTSNAMPVRQVTNAASQLEVSFFLKVQLYIYHEASKSTQWYYTSIMTYLRYQILTVWPINFFNKRASTN